MISYRDLTTLDEFAAVVDLERRIWGPGYEDVVPVPILAVTAMRGAILVGAFEGASMVGFVYSIPGLKHGRAMHWSHMLGVIDPFRRSGVGGELKRRQRDRALSMGLDLIEWTFDPMQALNAHLNFTKLGAVSDEYEENVYGSSQSPLHRGNPTDRLVAQWNIRDPHVERRLAGSLHERSTETGGVPHVNRAKPSGELPECEIVDLAIESRRVQVEIPMGFTEMLSRAPDLALAWRMSTRLIFTTYFARGYRAVDFMLDRGARKGAYLLAAA
jgi:chorismate synthase